MRVGPSFEEAELLVHNEARSIFHGPAHHGCITPAFRRKCHSALSHEIDIDICNSKTGEFYMLDIPLMSIPCMENYWQSILAAPSMSRPVLARGEGSHSRDGQRICCGVGCLAPRPEHPAFRWNSPRS